MPRRSLAHERVHAIADEQLGLITAAQLRETGIARSTVASRESPGGMWSRVLPGVHFVGGGRLTPQQWEYAALLYSGDRSRLTGLTAMNRYGLSIGRRPTAAPEPHVRDLVHVLVPHDVRRVSTHGVRVERTRRMPSDDGCRVIDQLHLVPPARAVADAARRMRNARDVRAIALEACRSGLTDAEALQQEVENGPTRGSAHLRAALGLARDNVWSVAEGDAHDLMVETGLPTPRWNVTVLTASGRFLGIPDAWFDEVAFAVEVDSEEHHADGEGWRRTLARQQRYARAGVVSLPLTPREIRTDRDGTVRAIREGYAAAAARPRPAVRMSNLPDVPAARMPPLRWGG